MTTRLNRRQVAGLAALAAVALLPAAAPANPPSWVFNRSTYTHDPYTGARVAQYERVAPVEDLDDPRLVTSRYRRVRTVNRGPDGGLDITYEVQNYANGRGGLDAEWERFHDAWRQSLLTGSYYYQNRPTPYGAAYGYPGAGYGPGYGGPGYGGPGGPGFGGPGGPGGPGFGGPGGPGFPGGPGGPGGGPGGPMPPMAP